MPDATSLIIERLRIEEVINQLFVATDRRDWAAVRACFAPEVRFDMTSLAGGAPTTMTPAQIAAGWETGLAPIESVHHQVGNHLITLDVGGERASGFCYGIAIHYKKTRGGQNTRTFVGSYDFLFRRAGEAWLIEAFRFNLKFLEGNLELEKG